jgi:ketosteroid isomerase-like protein
MPRIRFRAASFAALLAFASPLGAHEPKATSAQPATLPASARGAATTVDAFHAALDRGDARSAASLLADDALIFEEGGVERSKAEYVAHHLPADAAFSRVVASSVTRRVGGSNGALAWIESEGRMKGNYKGKAVDRVTTETMLLRLVGRHWKIVHIHWSSGAAQ